MDFNDKNVQLVIRRLDEKLLYQYFNKKDNFFCSALELRHLLLQIELKELEKNEKWPQSNSFVKCDQVNLLPYKDDISVFQKQKLGPKSRTRLKTDDLQGKAMPKSVLIQKLSEIFPNLSSQTYDNHVKSRKSTDHSQLTLEYDDYDHFDFNDLSDDKDNILKEQENERSDNLPEIKVEVLVNGDIDVKSNDLVIEKSDEKTVTRKKRGRPRKKRENLYKPPQENDSILAHLSCKNCSFIGISDEVLQKHMQELHSLTDENVFKEEVDENTNIKTEDENTIWDNTFDLDTSYISDNPEDTSYDPERPLVKKKKKLCCSKCSYKTDNENLFNTHLDHRHSEKSVQNLVKCSYCNEDIERRKMEQHLYAKHKDVKMHICDQCPFKTNSLTNLTRHIDNMHLAIK